MGPAKEIGKFIAENLLKSVIATAATKVGEAVGDRLARRLEPEPPPVPWGWTLAHNVAVAMAVERSHAKNDR